MTGNLDLSGVKMVTHILSIIEMDVQLAIMDKMERIAKGEMERKRLVSVRNQIYKIACFSGLA